MVKKLVKLDRQLEAYAGQNSYLQTGTVMRPGLVGRSWRSCKRHCRPSNIDFDDKSQNSSSPRSSSRHLRAGACIFSDKSGEADNLIQEPSNYEQKISESGEAFYGATKASLTLYVRSSFCCSQRLRGALRALYSFGKKEVSAR